MADLMAQMAECWYATLTARIFSQKWSKLEMIFLSIYFSTYQLKVILFPSANFVVENIEVQKSR